MKLLLDTHSFIWAVDDPAKLGVNAEKELQTPANELCLSAASIWEIAIKIGLKKITLSLPYGRWMSQAMTDLAVTILAITVEYAEVQAGLPYHHGDPFDRLLISQAMVEKIPIVSSDPAFDAYGITRIWK